MTATNEIKVFENTEFGQLNVMLIDGKEYFPAIQCAKILGYKNAKDAIRRHCKGVVKHALLTNGGEQSVSCITEGDLYRLIVSSKLPTAEKFERWIFDEVLPTIRKTGGYVSDVNTFLNSYMPFADEATKNLFALQFETIKQLSTKIKEDEPLVEFASHIQVSKDCVDMKTMAQIAAKNGVNIGRTRLYRFLKEKKVLSEDNLPYQKYIEYQPWFQVKESVFVTPYGTKKIRNTPSVTPKGQVGIVRMLRKHFGLPPKPIELL